MVEAALLQASPIPLLVCGAGGVTSVVNVFMRFMDGGCLGVLVTLVWVEWCVHLRHVHNCMYARTRMREHARSCPPQEVYFLICLSGNRPWCIPYNLIVYLAKCPCVQQLAFMLCHEINVMACPCVAPLRYTLFKSRVLSDASVTFGALCPLDT